MKITLPIFILYISFASCRHKDTSPDFFAKQYCECLERNDAEKDFFDARVKCDGELISQSNLFRIIYIENTYGRYMFLLPDDIRDSAVKFNHRFNAYLEKNCCKIAFEGCNTEDSMQIKRKLMGK
jgi:hypothetical protein